MGQILSQPVTDKFSETGENDKLYYGVSSMQGWRVTMEDAHAAVLDLVAGGPGPAGVAKIVSVPENAESAKSGISADEAPAVAAAGQVAAETAANGSLGKQAPTAAYFGVYDGHGGDKTAIFAGEASHKLVAATPAFAKGDYGKALQDGFLATDQAILDKGPAALDASGCAATAVIVTDEVIVCGNAGDSRTVLGTLGSAKSLSFDHKPDNEGERARITAAGGFVDMGRVNGNLALSRAMGDFTFKKSPQIPPEEQVVTAYPDIVERRIKPTDEFIVLACDGIWDCMDPQEVVEFVRRAIADKLPLPEICELLMDECLAPESEMSGIGCDNMTVCIVALLQGQTKEQWYNAIAERVANGVGPVAQRSTQEVREAIEARSAPSVGHDEDEDAVNAATSPQAMLQQLFAGADPAGGRLNPEATSLLSRLGIRFIGAGEEDGADYADPNDSESTLVTDEDASVDHDEGDVSEEARTPRDAWE